MENSIEIRKAAVHNSDAETAVSALYEEIHQDRESLVLVFASSSYDMSILGSVLKSKFGDVVAGCTTAGQIGPQGYQQGGITGVSIASQHLQARSFLVTPLNSPEDAVQQISRQIHQSGFLDDQSKNYVGLVHLDGLSMSEERTMHALHHELPDIALVGGSAGDELRFEKTYVYYDGSFIENAAVLTLISTTLEIHAIKFQHHQPTNTRMVITKAIPEERRVIEINGLPAAQAYAEATGVPVEELNPKVYSKHPMMFRFGEEFYTRSIRSVHADQSMTFYCAIEEGLVLRLGSGDNIAEKLESSLNAAEQTMNNCNLIIGYDCILRRLEIEREGISEDVGKIMAKHNVIGFNTYGEQYNGIHINQTFTGLALGQRSQPSLPPSTL